LGRLGKTRHSGSIAAIEAELPTSRIRDWWILEGKRYRGLEAGLSHSMPYVHRHAVSLLATYNPRWRTSPAPHGETDWIATALRRATTTERDYVVRTSHTGLDEKERDVLLIWITWLRELHGDYFAKLKLAAPPLPEWAHARPPSVPSPERLGRWAQIARRSRWPLLRNVVAESLRCLMEPDALDQLPLPTAHEELFELACLVRILKALSSREAALRWLDRDLDNAVQTPELTVSYQHWLKDEVILRADVYPPEALEAMTAHRIYPPRRADLLIQLTTPRGGFQGLLVECKSGAVEVKETIYQLLVYRSALRRRFPGRLLVWGIVETPFPPAFPVAESSSDCWIFSSADHIPAVLEHLGLAPKR
jgi:hypothetical protein